MLHLSLLERYFNHPMMRYNEKFATEMNFHAKIVEVFKLIDFILSQMVHSRTVCHT